ncbi:hypothetical protein [Roseibium aggregatum]|uniref:hypothetical protein n=1 Tax=Roseibium aggregatum TaxID=187304 RepID=UPI001A8E33F7|nr:hypothetical protein [Roseibium aggregatum]MBN8179298.1 hypothetical protein [Roseibium aggregatum]UES46474.1 hypothetical protein GFK90_23300 [Roseibium aggregatum]
MKLIFLFFVFIFSHVCAASSSTPLSDKDAERITSEMMLQLEQLHERLMEILELQDPTERQPELERIREELEEIQVPYQTALQSIETQPQESSSFTRRSHLKDLWKCQKAVAVLVTFSDIVVQPEVRFRSPTRVQKTYFDFLSKSEDCRYQLGKEPSAELDTPARVFQAYLRVMERTLREMKDLDDPGFLAETRGDQYEWFRFKEKIYWRLYSENSWELYRLYAITSGLSLRSEEYRNEVRAFGACRTMQGSFMQLVDKYSFFLARDIPGLLHDRSLNRLVTKFAECEAALSDK